VRQALRDTFTPPSTLDLLDVTHDCDYQEPEGYPPLVAALERRHGQHVVITCGAKQALMATFVAAKQAGMFGVALRSPYWPQMLPAIEAAGLVPVTSDIPIPGCAYLLVSPNNPDGHVTSLAEALVLQEQCRQLGVPLIHDGAYHGPIYVPGELSCLASTSIFSIAKQYGLSGLRVGYIVTDDPVVKQVACDYVETTTVGASALSQRAVHRILEQEEATPGLRELFTHRAQLLLAQAKQVAAKLHPDVLNATGVEQSIGMFGWFKVGSRFDANRARIAVAPGEAFGDDTRVRLNLAIEQHLLYEAVDRLNAL